MITESKTSEGTMDIMLTWIGWVSFHWIQHILSRYCLLLLLHLIFFYIKVFLDRFRRLTKCEFHNLGPIHTSHFVTQYCDKKIKRYFNIEIFLTNIFFTMWIENIYFCLFEKILKCYHNTYIFYQELVYQNVSYE